MKPELDPQDKLILEALETMGPSTEDEVYEWIIQKIGRKQFDILFNETLH